MRVQPTGENRANRFMLVLVGLQRAAWLLPATVVVGSPVYRSPVLNAFLLACTVAWNVVLFHHATRLGRTPVLLMAVDVVLAVVLLVLVSVNLAAGAAGTATTWAYGLFQASASLVGAAAVRLSSAVAGVSVLVVAMAVVTVAQSGEGGNIALEVVIAVNKVLCFAIVARMAVQYLRREGRTVDRLNERRLAAETQRAADHARYVTRMAHHRALHDTVLTTLTVIARGGFDHRGEQVRRRCARDADFIRRLISDPERAAFDTVAGALQEMVSETALLGLRIHYRGSPNPTDLPPEAVAALRDATREALNNVLKHAGVDQAWVTLSGGRGAARVTVVDRGRGFDQGQDRAGFGLRNSIADRMASVGGRSRISSEPGGGTCVELSWPR